MALKDWKNVRRNKIWYNSHINQWLRIYSEGEKEDLMFDIELELPNGQLRGVKGNPFNSQSEALAFAKSYMRTH